ncbi:MAG: hypothetical protein ACOYMA_02995 [Bacteroidia bacterium]
MKNYILKIVILTLILGNNFKGNSSIIRHPHSIKPNTTVITGLNYAFIDAGGAWGWGSWGSIGGPMGTALGIVVGACATSGWAFVYNNQTPSKIKSPTNTEVTNFSNEFERVGFLHNKFLVSFINSHQQTFSNEEDFVNAIYIPLCTFVSLEYNIGIEEIKTSFKKTDLINLCKSYTSANDISDYAQIVFSNGESVNLRNEYVRIANQLSIEHLNGINFSANYLNNEINNYATNNVLNEHEKLVSIYSCNILKYSLFLWSSN